ncbi:MAG: MauE/DoxX family redox-associated membrane protein [Salibacteraceae bacterium]
MKYLSWISRQLVGSLFIVSGLIKANDPLGFSYKLHDYFAADVFDLPGLEPYALGLAVFICVSEILLGVAVLMRAQMVLSSISLFVMIVFFTFLTFYSAAYDKVTDCGCFGDALKLTPWESFTKDVVLLVFILIILIDELGLKRNRPEDQGGVFSDEVTFGVSVVLIALFSFGVISWGGPVWFTLLLLAIVYGLRKAVKIASMDWIIAGFAAVYSLGFSYYCIENLPIRDYRPYAVGKSIPEGMKTAEELGVPAPVYANMYIKKRKSTNETFQMNSNDYLVKEVWKDQDLELVEATEEVITIQEGYEAPIHDFNLMSKDGNDDTDLILALPRVFLLISKDISILEEGNMAKVKQLVTDGQAQGIPTVLLSSTNFEEQEAFMQKHGIEVPFYQADNTTLKTIIRANPGIVLLKNGVVNGKWHHNNTPSLADSGA